MTETNEQATTAAAAPAVTNFHFKATKSIKVQPTGKTEAGEYVFDEEGNALIAQGFVYSDKGWKRPSAAVVLPAATEDDIINALAAGGQVKQFLLGITGDAFYNAARSKINDLLESNPLAVITAETVAAFDLSLESMAAAYLEEAASARATGIAKEVWDDFVSDYVTVMLRELPENGEDKIKNAADHLKLRFQKCRSHKGMVAKLQTYLAVWYAATARQEEFAKLYTTLDERAKVLLAVDDENSI